MILYKKAASRGFAAGRDGVRIRYELDVIRLLVAVVLVAMVFGGAYAFRRQGWQEGANVLLHLGEIAFGGLVGLLFGERQVRQEIR